MMVVIKKTKSIFKDDKHSGSSLILNMQLPYSLAIPLLDICPMEMNKPVHTKACI